jgi:tetratricopeptide (TPR) repeat protein
MMFMALFFAAAPLVWGAEPRAAKDDATGKVPISTKSAPAKQAYLQGRDLLEHLKNEEAHQAFARAAMADREFGMAVYGLALSAPDQAGFRAALQKASELVRAGKMSEGEKHMIGGVEAGFSSQAAMALQHLTTLVRDYPDDERAHTLLGGLYLSLHQWQLGIDEFRKAIAINPEPPPPYAKLALALRMQEKYDEAEQAAKKYIELIPNNTKPVTSYADLLMKAGRFADSIAQYEKALKLDGKLVDAFVGIANDQIFMGKPQEARNTLTKLESVATNVDDRHQAHFWKAVSFLHEEKTQPALDEVQRMYDLARRDSNRAAMAGDLNLMGAIRLELGQADAALAKYNEGLAIIDSSDLPSATKDTVHRNSLYDVARVKLVKKDLVGAEADAKKYREGVAAEKLQAEVCRSHELDGLVALAKGDATTAVRELEQANMLDPRALFALGEAYAAAGNAAAAKTAFTHAANFNSPELGYAFVRAKAQAKLTK